MVFYHEEDFSSQTPVQESVIDELMYILSSGYGFFQRTFETDVSCSFDFAKMPFDTQKCKISLVDRQMTIPGQFLLWDSVIAADTFKTTTGQWELDRPDSHTVYHGAGSDSSANVEAANPLWKRGEKVISARGIPGQHSALTLEFELRRNYSYLQKSFVFPGIIYWFMSWLGLGIGGAAVPARAAAGLIPALMLANLRVGLIAKLPPLSYGTKLVRGFLTRGNIGSSS